jgi:hypothetical protein
MESLLGRTKNERDSQSFEGLQERKNDLRILHGSEIDRHTIRQTFEIDRVTYPSEFCGSAEHALSMFAVEPSIYTVAVSSRTKELIGYCCAIPLYDEYYDLVAAGKCLDIDLPPEAIRSYREPGNYKMCLSFVAVLPSYSEGLASKALFVGYLQKLLGLADKGIFLSHLVVDAVTPKGKGLCVGLQLDQLGPSEHHSTIFVSEINPSSRLLSANSTLVARYAEHFRKVGEKKVA